MEEQRSFRQQAFGRVRFFDDDRGGHTAQTKLLFPRQLLPGVNNNRKVLAVGVPLKSLDQLKTGHVGKFEIENHAVEAFIVQLT